MTEIIIFVLGIALLLYILLGGADFGAGIVEMVTGKKGMDIISRAIAPVWEANHVWVILAVVILFNAFPAVYSLVGTYLHIPLLIALVGIVLRGSAFTFRYYDAIKDRSQYYYTVLFRISSVLAPFFYGVVVGAMILGKIPGPGEEGSFYDLFIAPWLNLFTIITGLFLTLLFGWLASIYLIGEANTKRIHDLFVKTAMLFYILLILSGLGIFLAAKYYEVSLFREFLKSPVSLGCMIIATIIIPFVWQSIIRRQTGMTRLLAGVQTACILTGWFGIQFPVMVYLHSGTPLTVYNSRAPEATMVTLFWALLVGIVIIFPSIFYLLNVFKFKKEKKT